MAEPIGALRAELSANSAQFEKDMKKARGAARTAARGIDSSFKRIKGAAGRLSKSIFSARTAMIGLAGAAGLGLLIKKSLDAADAIAKTADSIGISTDALQEYRFAADIAGVSQAALDSSFSAFSKRVGEARANTGTLITILRQMDPVLLNVVQSARSTEEAFEAIVEAGRKLDNQLDRNALFAAAFGRTAGVAMTNLIKKGSASIDEMRQKARDLGIVIDESLLRRAEAAKDALARLSNVIRSKVIGAVIELSPQIEQLADALVKGLPALVSWVQEFGRFIGLFDQDIFVRVEELTDEIEKLQKVIDNPPIGDFLLTAIGGEASAAVDKIKVLKAELRTLLSDLASRRDKPPAATLPGGNSVGGVNPVVEGNIDRIVAALNFEREQLVRNKEEQKLYNLAKQAGVKDMDAFIARVRPLIQQLTLEAQRTKAVVDLKKEDEELTKMAAALIAENLTLKEKQFIAESKILELKPILIELLGDEAEATEFLKRALEKLGKQTDDNARAAQATSAAFSSFFTSAVQGAGNFASALDSLINRLLSIASNKIFDNIVGLLFEGLGSLAFGGSSTGVNIPHSAAIPTAKGAAYFRGRVQRFGRGGITAGASLFPTAGGVGLMGEAGPEAILPLARLPGGDLGVRTAGGGGDVIVQVINNTAESARVESSEGDNGNRSIMVVIGEAMGDDVQRGGPLGRSIERAFLTTRRTAGR